MKPGNAENSKINGEWSKHVRWFGKKVTAKIRRAEDKKNIKKNLEV